MKKVNLIGDGRKVNQGGGRRPRGMKSTTGSEERGYLLRAPDSVANSANVSFGLGALECLSRAVAAYVVGLQLKEDSQPIFDLSHRRS